MLKRKLSKGIRKYIRKEKARIRREVLDVKEQKIKIGELYKNLLEPVISKKQPEKSVSKKNLKEKTTKKEVKKRKMRGKNKGANKKDKIAKTQIKEENTSSKHTTGLKFKPQSIKLKHKTKK